MATRGKQAGIRKDVDIYPRANHDCMTQLPSPATSAMEVISPSSAAWDGATECKKLKKANIHEFVWGGAKGVTAPSKQHLEIKGSQRKAKEAKGT